jgi:hypothetical protein
MRWRLPKPTVIAVTALLLAAAAAGIGTGVVADDGGAPLRGRVPVLTRTSARPGHANRGAARAVTAPPPAAGGHEAVTWAAAPADMGALSGLGVPAMPGDYAQAGPPTAWYPVESWFYLDGIVVTVPRQAGTVVAFGDSITDGVVDFDRAVRDPADPLRIAPAYDSGDHIHPDDAGYQAMADAVGLALLR